MVNGDSCLIRTPTNKTILIDTGEEENILKEYLLDRKIKKIDYLLITHFDSDHCLNAVEIIETLKVRNLIISRQVENTNEFERIIKVAQSKNVKIMQVEAGETLKVDKYIYFNILWPDNGSIKETLNNNSIVAKMYYKNFTILFTGDIEKEAEQEIVAKYGGKLETTILKVAHHRFKKLNNTRIFKCS